ncbi:MAG: ferritin family protein [Candidatus Korobacteraceae bacterium]|jgi:erythrin-vacuolar iron transport family protein
MKNFSSLSGQEALEIAISIEKRNAEIYHRFAEMFTEFGDEGSLEIAGVFWEMAVEERSHRALLQQKYTEQYGDSTCSLTEEDLVELIEVPRLENGDVFGAGNAITARGRALRVALQAELSAQGFYAKLTEQTPPGPLRQVYCDLATMEDDHVASLEAKLAQDTAEHPKLQ